MNYADKAYKKFMDRALFDDSGFVVNEYGEVIDIYNLEFVINNATLIHEYQDENGTPADPTILIKYEDGSKLEVINPLQMFKPMYMMLFQEV